MGRDNAAEVLSFTLNQAIERPSRRRGAWQPRSLLAFLLAALAALCLICRHQGTKTKAPTRSTGADLTLFSENPCDKYPYLKFEVPNAVAYSNLGNRGPDNYNGEGMVYKTIDLGKGAGDMLNREVYMTINGTGPGYAPFSPRLNGMQGKYGSINLNSDSRVDLIFNFYDMHTREQLTLPEFAMTWFDLDTGKGGFSAEYVVIGGFTKYKLTDTSEVQVQKQPDGRVKFSGTTYGTGEDNPLDPMFLTQQQRDRAVTLLFGPTKTLNVTVGALPGLSPRFFTFVGRPSLLCAVTVQDHYKPPLPDLTWNPPREHALIANMGEKFVSFEVLKGSQVSKGDLLVTTQIHGIMKEYKAPCDGIVTQIQDKLRVGDDLDMRLSEKIMLVVKKPTISPLALEIGDVPGGPGQSDSVPLEALFVEYTVNVGDRVAEGDPIAIITKNTGGKKDFVRSIGYGMVTQRQEELKAGMPVGLVADYNLVTLGPYKALGPLNEMNVMAAQVPPDQAREFKFQRYLIKLGDIIKEGDVVAYAKDHNGNQVPIKATHGGVVSGMQDLAEGTPIDRIEDDNLVTTGRFPSLPVGPNMAAVTMQGASSPPVPSSGLGNPMLGGGEEAPLKILSPEQALSLAKDEGQAPAASQDTINPSGLRFVKYYVKPGDIVETEDKIARVEDAAGVDHDVLAPRPGVVKYIQDGLQKGMLIAKVMQDTNIAVIDKLPILEVDDTEEGAYAPRLENWRLKEITVSEGDYVSRGDTVAILEKGGELRYIPSSRSGDVTEVMQHIKPGDVVEEVTKDDDLVTVGLIQEPKLGFMERAVQVPDMSCIFVDWKIKMGQHVKAGDTIAHFLLPPLTSKPSGSDKFRRLESTLLSIPSPGTGKISYMADLQPNQRTSKQSAGPSIAAVHLDFPDIPWWILLLVVLCCLICCCVAFLFKVLRRKDDYKPMETTPVPVPETKPKAAPLPPKPVAVAPVAVASKPKPIVKPALKAPSGLRLDWDDNGTIRTTYARHRSLGIKHNYTAPIVVTDFTCNSYAKMDMGVQRGWKLTRIGDEELNDSNDFDYVNQRLNNHMQDFPVWPLALEFRKNPEDKETHVYKFSNRPLGVEFTNMAPIQIDRVYEDSPAAAHNMELGWYLTKIGDRDVHENTNFREVLQYFKEGVQGLQDELHQYTDGTDGYVNNNGSNP